MSIECLLILLAFKIALPKSMFINRGNHEDEMINKTHGFHKECCIKYNEEVFSVANRVMEYLPVAHLIKNKIFVVHDGLAKKQDFMIDELRGRFRVLDPYNDSTIYEMLWADPHDGVGFANAGRGSISEELGFGRDITKAFIKRNNLKCIIRSHQLVNTGYKTEHNGRCATVFSVPIISTMSKG